MKQTILIIEDNTEMCSNIADIMQLGGYDVLTAHNGKEGIELAHKHTPSLVLCDIMMPELDGYGVLHILNKHPDTSGIPFIFLTAKAEKADFRMGMNLGADDYIVKPFDGMELLKAVEMRLKKSEQLKTSFESGKDDLSAFFEKVSQMKEFSGLSGGKSNRVYRKKDRIFMEGELPKEVFFIVKGEVKTFRINYDGKELITGMHNDGQFIGYLSLLKNTAYNESAVTLSDTEVSTIPREDFLSLIHTNREVAAQFIKILSNNLFDVEKRLLDLAYQSVRQRVASALLYLYKQQKVDERSDLLIKAARKDIASIVGTAIESLNRTLSDFRDEGLVEITDGGIRLIRMDKLEKLSR